MDYRANFAHLLQHMVRELPEKCEQECPVKYEKGGGTSFRTGSLATYSGPSLRNLFQAMREIGYVAGVNIETQQPQYFPTPLGIEYLQQYKSLTKVWLKKNWFPATVAVITTIVAIASISLV